MTETPKFLSYTDRWSAKPGESVDVMVSTDADSFTAQLVRLVRGGPRPPAEDDVFEYETVGEEAVHEGRRYELHSGSCVVVPVEPSILDGLEGVTFQAWIWPTRADLDEFQAIVGWDGFSFGVKGGRLTVEANGGGVFAADAPVLDRRWYWVAVSLDASRGTVSIHQRPKRRFAAEAADTDWTGHLEAPVGSATELVIGAASAPLVQGEQRRIVAPFNGKIAAPRLLGRAVDAAALRSADPFDPASLGTEALIGAWDFTREISTIQVPDAGPRGLHGTTYNTPVRAVTGPSWDTEEFDYRHAPDQYDAIHFHDDDVEDCRWPAAVRLAIPADVRSGVYACRLAADGEEDFVPIFVRPGAGPRRKLAFLISTFTYMAYSNFETSSAPVEEFTGDNLTDSRDAWVSGHREVGWSMYDQHTDGSGIHHVSQHRPMVTIRHDYRWWMSYGGWHFSGDMFLVDWLEAKGFEYDVITDHDLHAEGVDLLDGYDCVLTGMHPEYYSAQMLDAIEEYAHERGGNLMYLGGNGFYWVMTQLPDRPHVLELRRSYAGTRTWQGLPGEDRHSSTGEQGGLWRHRGRAPQSIVGVGFIAEGGGGSADYVRLPDSNDPRVAFIFEGIGEDEVIGSFGNNSGGAAGDEIDHVDFSLGTPPDALILATSSLRHNDYYLLTVEDILFTLPDLGGTKHPDVRADMVFFETVGGGAVFTPGSIDWVASLSHNEYQNNVSKITENVVRRFLDW